MQAQRRRIEQSIVDCRPQNAVQILGNEFTARRCRVESELKVAIIELHSNSRDDYALLAARRRTLMMRVAVRFIVATLRLATTSLTKLGFGEFERIMLVAMRTMAVAASVPNRIRARLNRFRTTHDRRVRVVPTAAEHGVQGNCDGNSE